jgi:hypothetical protein
MENNDELYNTLRGEIHSFNSKYIPLEKLHLMAEGLSYDMPSFLQSPEGQTMFNHLISRLVSEQVIAPVGNKPATAQGLYLKYRINSKQQKQDYGLITQITKRISPPAAVDYYIKNPQDFLYDLDIIDTIVSFLKQEKKDLLTVNERAYQLFGDEKFFKGAGKNRSFGETVLKRLGLSFSNIGCEETFEPFFSFQKQNFYSHGANNVYIIENKDTFWSFKRNLMDCPAQFTVDMLVYGEGKKIISSFKFIDEYAIDPQTDEFFYFGDLDAEGVNIYCELLDEYPQYRIVPFYEGYQAVLEIGLSKEPVKTPKQQRIKDENIDRFTTGFDQSWATKLNQHLKDGFYVPQEALSAIEMKNRFGRISND